MTSDLRTRLLICAAIGFAGCAVGLLIDAKTMLASYLTAWTALSAIPIGALAVLLTSYLVRAGWTRDLHVLLSGATLTLPVIAVLFVPVFAGMSALYPWAAGATALPAFKAAYLTPWFFILRTIIYFAAWTALAVWAARAYGSDAAMKRVASAGLIIWALTASWAGVDWFESVEPHFHSSIYGLLIVSFDLLAGLAFGVFALLLSNQNRSMSNTAYAGVLLSVLLLWAYLHAMQYIIIWTGNIPEEVTWYLKRLDGAWAIALWLLFVGQFIVPFFALLSSGIRASTRALLYLAGATIALRYLEAAVLLLPPLDVSNLGLILDLPAAILATGASWLLAFGFTIGVVEQRRLSRAAAAH
jgi:hypothetical protein